MTDIGKIHSELAQATAAQGELEQTGRAFDALEAEYVKAWKSTPARDTDARERLWQAVQIVGKVRSHLVATAAGRAMLERQIADIARMGEDKKIIGIV